ncbi:hypothetical protein BH11ACT7_BH11ACT7_20500 [soil metagenome]
MSNDKPETVPAGDTSKDDAPKDIVSDPGKGAGDGSDWADEGGATSDGPATDPDDG